MDQQQAKENNKIMSNLSNLNDTVIEVGLTEDVLSISQEENDAANTGDEAATSELTTKNDEGNRTCLYVEKVRSVK